eukprot:TRINITY_DN66613_c6_g1_i1.p1 TRINITY_DN66613_c6_g1~~TRINITY_DN66613_c6_g1_i1.p1  ORF type:complete len:552 (-),score=282.87 TRINITY_DN66613_c6_g1_i1:95-1750(-)
MPAVRRVASWCATRSLAIGSASIRRSDPCNNNNNNNSSSSSKRRKRKMPRSMKAPTKRTKTKNKKTKDSKRKGTKKKAGDKNKNAADKRKEPYNSKAADYKFDKMIPVGTKMLARWRGDGKYHSCKILEGKEIAKLPDNSAAKKAVVAVQEKLKTMSPEELELVPEVKEEHPYVYYIHYPAFNRRMDEWTTRQWLMFDEELKAWEDTLNTNRSVKSDVVDLRARHVHTHHEDHGDFDEESLKAHEEVTKVKNIESIVLGRYEMETWYFSPFPAEYLKHKKLHFCEFCLSFFGLESELDRHLLKCQIRHPPGNEIYRSHEQNITISMFEVDGAKEMTYCQNLCYIAKLFLDHKTLHYDTVPFMFYILCEVSDVGCHLVGYFSKEKMSEEGYNVACILTLPCHQRKGYGKFLISFSYELSKIEGKVGSPEKPLSDLGAVSYKSYWKKVLLDILRDRKKPLSVHDLSRMTSIMHDDIIATLRDMGVIKYAKGEHVISVPKSLIDASNKKRKRITADRTSIRVEPADPAKIRWNPFLVDQKKTKYHFTELRPPDD